MKFKRRFLLFIRLLMAQALTLQSKVCLRRPTEGPCGPLVVAWCYDHINKYCKELNRTICGGGANDFVSEAKCQYICQHTRKPCCSLPPHPKRCLGSTLHWYFNMRWNNCQKFPNNLCGKNRNAFSSYGKCMERCSYKNSARGSVTHHASAKATLSRNQIGRFGSLRKFVKPS
uniref:Pancreatic trypsin inhibitor n=1 Tax=Rhipicephalus appendiculatus TaxID=34631 RepID=A0A131Z1K4_RHIAP